MKFPVSRCLSRIKKITQDVLILNPKETIVNCLILQFTLRPTDGADEVYLSTAVRNVNYQTRSDRGDLMM